MHEAGQVFEVMTVTGLTIFVTVAAVAVVTVAALSWSIEAVFVARLGVVIEELDVAIAVTGPVVAVAVTRLIVAVTVGRLVIAVTAVTGLVIAVSGFIVAMSVAGMTIVGTVAIGRRTTGQE